MSYSVVVRAGRARVDLAGFAVALPFGFDGVGSYGLRPDLALACCHIVRNASNVARYDSPSQELIGQLTFDFQDAQNRSVFQLNDYSTALYLPSETIGCGESVVVLKGNTSVGNTISGLALPGQPFTDWGYNAPDNSLFTWSGELVDGGTRLLKVCSVRAPVAMSSQALLSFAALGPTTDGQQLFPWLIQKGRGLQNTTRGIVPDYTGGALAALDFKDRRRNTSIALFGGDGHGTAQVIGSNGAALLCQGTYARAGALRRLLALAAAAVSNSDPQIERAAANVFLDPALEDAMSRTTRITAPGQTLFEGLAVWGLKPRIAPNGAQQPALPPPLL